MGPRFTLSAHRRQVAGAITAAVVVLSAMTGSPTTAAGSSTAADPHQAAATPNGGITAAAAATATETTWERGVIHAVADGDTVSVDVTWAANPQFIAPADPTKRSYCAERVSADGSLPADGDLDRCRIRLIGIQAPESAGASGGSALEQCKASAAKQALTAALPVGTRVELRSLAATSVEDQYSGGRLARTVYALDSSGHWVDAGRAVLTAGHALWFPFNPHDAEKPEYAHNLEYRRLVDAAATAKRGLWSAGYCGTSTQAPVRVWVVSDPIGEDAGREYAVIYNTGSTRLDLSDWTVRDSSLSRFHLPAGTVLAPHDYLRVYSGSPTARDYYFGGSTQMFPNWDPTAGPFYGDTVALFDVQPGYEYGNLQAWMHYPCDPASCTDPLAGVLRLGAVMYDPPGADTAAGEYVEVANTSTKAISLTGYALTRQGGQFEFPPNTTLAAGGTLRIVVGTGTDDASTLHMGRATSLLANSGDLLTVTNLNGTPLDCRAWGSMTCTGQLPGTGPTAPSPTDPTTPSPTPTTPVPVSERRPGAVTAVKAKVRGRRIVLTWAAPKATASPEVTTYRATIYRKAGARLTRKARCTTAASITKCRTPKLKRHSRYLVAVRAGNSLGFGPTVKVRVRIR